MFGIVLKSKLRGMVLLGLSIGVLLCFGCSKTKEQSGQPAGQLQTIPLADNRTDEQSFLLQGEAIGAVLMEVEEEVVTTQDALQTLEKPLTELGKASAGEQFRQQTENLILQYLRGRMAEIVLLNEARNGLSEEEKTQIQNRRQAYGDRLLRECDGSRTRLRNKLAQQGTTLEAELDKFDRELQIRLFLTRQFTSRINITRQDIMDYYLQRSDQYNTPKKVELLKIQVLDHQHSQPDETSEQARQRVAERAQQAWNELAQGRPFSEVAGKYSDTRAAEGGNWGLVDPNSLRDETERRAADTLEPGKYSQVLQTELGCSIIAVGQVVPAQQRPLEEVQEEIRQALWQQQYNRLYSERLAELGRQAVISASPLAMKMAVDLAEQRFAAGG